LIFLLVVLLILLAGVLYQAIGSALDLRRYPAPGRLIDVGGHRLHIHTEGQGSPVVVLEAGIAASSVSWRLVQDRLAPFTTVIAYDRAGLGYSDPSPQPRTIANILQDFQTLLSKAGISTPIILVGHSFGGLAALEYACVDKSRLAGLVLVDPLAASEWCPVQPQSQVMLNRGVQLARRGAWVARLGIVRLSLDLLRAGSRRIPKLAAKLSSGSGSQLTERLVGEVRKLPKELWPVVQSHWCQPKAFLSMAAHLESLPASAAACRSTCDLGDLPITVLSGANSAANRLAEHEAMAKRSTRGKLVIAQNSGHWIQLDEPDLVVTAVREIIEASR
jgi:pimeloyl-ACP methyl ester carboxylesterase